MFANYDTFEKSIAKAYFGKAFSQKLILVKLFPKSLFW